MNDHRLFLYQGRSWVFTDFYMETDYGTERGSQIKGTYVCDDTKETRAHVFSVVDYLPPCVTGDELEHRAVYSLIKGLATTWEPVELSRYNRLYTLKKETTVCRVTVNQPRHAVTFNYQDGVWARTQESTSFSVSWVDGAKNNGAVITIDNPFKSEYKIDRLYSDLVDSSSIYDRISSILTELL